MRCLEFTLPSGSAGMAAGMTKMAINRKLKELVDRKLINSYKSDLVGYRFYVWLENEQDYTTFFLVWDTNGNPWRVPKVIEKDYPADWGKNPWIQST